MQEVPTTLSGAGQEQNGQVLPNLQCLLGVANSHSHFMALLPCDLSAHLGGDSCLASTSSVFLSIFGLFYPHLFP